MYIEREKTMAWHFIVLFHDIFFIDQYTTIQDIQLWRFPLELQRTQTIFTETFFFIILLVISHTSYIFFKKISIKPIISKSLFFLNIQLKSQSTPDNERTSPSIFQYSLIA